MDDIKQPTTQLPKKKSAFKSFMIKFMIVVLLIAAFMIYWFFYNVYSDGERTGMLTKLSHKGNVFKTYEGEMMIGNIAQTAAGFANEKFYFSVADKKISDTLMKLQGQRISVKYNQYRRTLPWRGDNVYIVTGYEKVAY